MSGPRLLTANVYFIRGSRAPQGATAGGQAPAAEQAQGMGR